MEDILTILSRERERERVSPESSIFEIIGHVLSKNPYEGGREREGRGGSAGRSRGGRVSGAATIGACLSGQSGGRRASSSAAPLRRLPTEGGLSEPNPDKMKGLFKSKPRTPADTVRQTRDLLIFANRSPDPRENKRDEKVQSSLSPCVYLLQSLSN